VIKDVPHRLYSDTEKWLKTAKIRLDDFTTNTQDPNYIALEMLEGKGSPNSKHESPDIIT